MTRVPVRFTFTVSTELNCAMSRRRNATGGLLVPSRYTRGLVFSLYTRGLLVVSTRTSITILSPCASRHPRDLRYYHYYHYSKYHQYQDPRHRHLFGGAGHSLLDVLDPDTGGIWSGDNGGSIGGL
eukprot:scaffold127085_cov76-Attheya_sp.AAC.2